MNVILASIKNLLFYQDDTAVHTDEFVHDYLDKARATKSNRELLAILIDIVLNAVGLKIVDDESLIVPRGVYLTRIQRNRKDHAESADFLVGLL